MALHKIPVECLFENWINKVQHKRNPNIKLGPHDKPGPSEKKADRMHLKKQDKSLGTKQRDRTSDEENLSRL